MRELHAGPRCMRTQARINGGTVGIWVIGCISLSCWMCGENMERIQGIVGGVRVGRIGGVV